MTIRPGPELVPPADLLVVVKRTKNANIMIERRENNLLSPCLDLTNEDARGAAMAVAIRLIMKSRGRLSTPSTTAASSLIGEVR